MLEVQDDDPPSFVKQVNIKVTLDMLETSELVQELVDRKSLIVITARRKVPRDAYIKKGFYPAMRAVMSCDLAKELISQELVAEGVMQNKDDLEFSATIVVLQTVEDEKPI